MKKIRSLSVTLRIWMATLAVWLGLEKLLLAVLRRFPKLLTHEHLDCSVRPLTLLELWEKVGFEKAQTVPFPPKIIAAWKQAGNNKAKRQKVAALYQKHISKFASSSLKNYVECIVWTVLPVMQSRENLVRIARERIADAISDGVVAMELRFAPQLHTSSGLTLDEVMEAVESVVRTSPIHVSLIICALRHEDGVMCEKLADLAIRHREFVGKFDLAGDEHGAPGVLSWWIPQAMRVREFGIEPTIHLWETDQPTEEDLKRLDDAKINVLGHGFRGDDQGDRICTMCMTSNAVTGQVESVSKHVISEKFFAGVRLTIDTDGTLFTSTDATREYSLLLRNFGWWRTEFLVCNLTALEQMRFPSPAAKQKVRSRLLRFYCRGEA